MCDTPGISIRRMESGEVNWDLCVICQKSTSEEWKAEKLIEIYV